MNKDHYPMYAVALVAGASLALWAGMPLAFLFFLACPLMMLVMMTSMGGGQPHGDAPVEPTPADPLRSAAEEPRRL